MTKDIANMGVAAHFNVSLNSSGDLLHYFDAVSSNLHRSTVTRGVVECHFAALHGIAKKMEKSTDLWWSSDATGVQKGRDFLTIVFGGKASGKANGQFWWGLIEFKQISGEHTAIKELAYLLKSIEPIQELQTKMDEKVTKFYDL